MSSSNENDLASFLGPGELLAEYQPIVDLRSDKTVGFEVLARWQDGTGARKLPAQFIPQLEAAGAINTLTRALLKQAFRIASTLPAGCCFAVNISPLQLRDSSLPSQIRRIADDAGFCLGRLTVEITESAYLENLDQARCVLEELKELGIKLALDDFGTGYSSLAYLHALPFDELKVDQSFVRSMTCRRESRKIVAAVVGLGRSLGLVTVAEGVEQQSQAEMLRLLGCERAQGWFYGEPLSSEALSRYVQRTMLVSEPASSSLSDGTGPALCLEAMPMERYAQLQAIYDGAPVGLCFLDPCFRYVSLNRGLAEMNGLPIEAHLGHTVQEMAPAVYDEVKQYLDRALGGEAVSDVEAQFQTEKGVQTRMLSYQPAFDEGGEVVGISVAVVDITARRRAEENLRESEEHYRSMVELNPQVPWTLDPSGLALEISPRWGDFTGQSEQQASGLGWLQALHPDDLEPTIARFQHAISTGTPFQTEYRVSKGDGQWHWMRSRGAPRRNERGEILRWYGSAESIDTEKRYADELRVAAARLQAIIDAIPIGIVIAEAPTGRIVGRNPAARKILGQDPIAFDAVEDYAHRVTYVREGKRLASTDFPLARAILLGEATDAEDVYCDLGGDEGKWVRLTGTPLRNKQGTIFGAVATIQEREVDPVDPQTAPNLLLLST